jgi:hypothetical protein
VEQASVHSFSLLRARVRGCGLQSKTAHLLDRTWWGRLVCAREGLARAAGRQKESTAQASVPEETNEKAAKQPQARPYLAFAHTFFFLLSSTRDAGASVASPPTPHQNQDHSSKHTPDHVLLPK